MVAKGRINFSVNANIIERQKRLSKIFIGINWSEYIELFLAACVAYLEAAEKSANEGKVKRLYDIKLPLELQINFIMSCLSEEFEELVSSNLSREEFTDKHHDLLNSKDSVKGSVMRSWEEAFNKVYSTRTFPVFFGDKKPDGNLEDPKTRSNP